jgi:hypothetical protein
MSNPPDNTGGMNPGPEYRPKTPDPPSTAYSTPGITNNAPVIQPPEPVSPDTSANQDGKSRFGEGF